MFPNISKTPLEHQKAKKSFVSTQNLIKDSLSLWENFIKISIFASQMLQDWLHITIITLCHYNPPPQPCLCTSAFPLDQEQPTNQLVSWQHLGYRAWGVPDVQESDVVYRIKEMHSLVSELAVLATHHLRSHQHLVLGHQPQEVEPIFKQSKGQILNTYWTVLIEQLVLV